MNLEAFEAWLKKRGARVQEYRPRTIRGLVASARHVLDLHTASVAIDEWPMHPVARQSIERMHVFLGAAIPLATPQDAPERELSRALATYLERWVPPSAARKKVAHSVDDAGWALLLDGFRKNESLEARILDLIGATGLRISDVLGIERPAVLSAAKTGSVPLRVKGGKFRHKPVAGAPVAWGALIAAFRASPTATNVATLLCESSDVSSSGCAYQRVRRELVRIGTLVGVDGRLHLHRLRRTVIVQALRDGHDIALVAKAVDHENITTTARYADEARETQVAALQQSVAKRFAGKPETP